MPREVQAAAPAWRQGGVWYIVNIDDNRAQWAEELKKAGGDAEKALRSNEVFAVRIRPYAGEEFAALSTGNLQDALEFKLTGDANAPVEIRAGSMGSGTTKTIRDACETSILEVCGYNATRITDEEGNRLEPGLWTREPVLTGPRLVEFICNEAWDTNEFRALQDIARAVQKKSHLEAGMVKGFSSPLTGSPAITRASGGAVDGAEARRSSSQTKGLKKTSSEPDETVKI